VVEHGVDIRGYCVRLRDAIDGERGDGVTLFGFGRGGEGVEAEIDLPYDAVLRCVVAGGAVGEVSLHHGGHEEEADVALEGLVYEFVFGGGVVSECVGVFVGELVEWSLVVCLGRLVGGGVTDV